MLQKDFPANATQATIASYYLTCIVTGLFAPNCAKDWAFGVIEALDTPPVEIIDVATANDRESAMQALGAVPGDVNEQIAGRWLLSYVHDELAAGQFSPMAAARAAMRIVQSTGLPRDIWIDFDCLDDELQLAVNGTYGTPEEIGLDVLKALSRHSKVAT